MTEELIKQLIAELVPEITGTKITGFVIGPGAGVNVPRSMTFWNQGYEQIGLIAYNEPTLTLDFTFKAEKMGHPVRRVFEFEGGFELCDPEIRPKIKAFMAKAGFTDLYDFSRIEGV